MLTAISGLSCSHLSAPGMGGGQPPAAGRRPRVSLAPIAFDIRRHSLQTVNSYNHASYQRRPWKHKRVSTFAVVLLIAYPIVLALENPVCPQLAARRSKAEPISLAPSVCALGSVESSLFYTFVRLIIHQVFVVCCVNDARPARERHPKLYTTPGPAPTAAGRAGRPWRVR